MGPIGITAMYGTAGTDEIKSLAGKFEEHSKTIENKIHDVQEELMKLNNSIETDTCSYCYVVTSNKNY